MTMAATTTAQAPAVAAQASALAAWERRAVEFAQTKLGRIAIVAIFTYLMFGLRMPFWWQTGIVLTLTSMFPAKRWWIITAAAMAWVFLEPPISHTLIQTLAPAKGAEGWLKFWPVSIVGAWAIAWIYLLAVRKLPNTPVARRPILCLLLLFAAMLVVMSKAPLTGASWFFVVTITLAFGQYLWFFAYTIADNASRSKHPQPKEMGAWRPFWGFTAVPYGKGTAYLSRVEAKNDQQLAETQLRGLKLMVRAAFLTILLVLGNRFIYGDTSGSLTAMPYSTPDPLIPPYPQALDAMKEGHPYPVYMRWLVLWASFFLRVTVLAIFGHKVIAIARMAGFDAFRNTYRPFSSTSVADLFNRVYYYFKELLVTFFFYPTYLRYFKKHPKLRLFTATLAAAGLGNFLFHFLRDSQNVLVLGPWKAIRFYESYAVYAFFLGTAIALSQLRTLNRGKTPAPTAGRKYAAIAGVLFFYTFLCIFEEPNPHHGLMDFLNYFASLFRP